MNKTLFFNVWVVLIVLTIIVAIISESNMLYTSILIIALSIVKFLGVSFYFMELRKSHPFWKLSVLIFVVLFAITVIILI